MKFDTVFALSTPVGGAIAVIRASGELCLPVLRRIFSGRIAASELHFGRIAANGEVIDEAMAVFFPSPHSYTGEDMLELHLHGSPAVIGAVSELLIREGLRAAEPGEFTKRAFLNGKLDLVQADAVMALINAETRRSASAALDRLRGGPSSRIAAVEDALISLAGELAAAMDYPEEMEDEVLSSVQDVLSPALSELDALIEGARRDRLLADGAKTVLLGPPNAGKSSLMNALLGVERAIVTDIAGTTRDLLFERLELNGIPVRLVDTAGLRENGESPVERVGIERALAEAESAELVLLVFDGTSGGLTPDERELVKGFSTRPAVIVINKCDLDESACREFAREAAFAEAEGGALNTVVVSAATGEGLPLLRERIAEMLGAASGENASLTASARQLERLSFARSELACACAESTADLALSLVSSALGALSELTGREFSEELLDSIFSRFCVGK